MASKSKMSASLCSPEQLERLAKGMCSDLRMLDRAMIEHAQDAERLAHVTAAHLRLEQAIVSLELAVAA